MTTLTTKYKPYPAYRPCGVEWLGDVPAHWEVKRLRVTVQSSQNGVWGAEPNGENDIACARVADFDRIRLRADMGKPTFRSIESGVIQTHLLYPGDLLLEGSGGGEKQPVGAVVLFDSKKPAVCSNFIAQLRPSNGFESRFLTYLHFTLYSARVNVRSIKQSTGIQNLDKASYLNEAVALPPLPEQRSIAAFLDRETARIDELVSRKERLIGLLQEKRTARITRAVTRGLDPTAPMKDSGVEWLGEIPAHWGVKRLKYLLREPLQYGANEPSSHTDSDSPRYVRITDIYDDGTLRGDTFRSIPNDIAEPYLLAEGDLLFARSGATVGKTFRYDPSWGIAAYAGYLIRARFDEGLAAPAFVEYFTRSQSYADWILGNFIQSTIQNVSAERYANLIVPKPPIPEQRAIADFLDRETAKLDALIAKIQEAIDRLRELRIALISAAVTGRIDVREEAG